MPIHETKKGQTLFQCEDCGRFVAPVDLFEGWASVYLDRNVAPWDETFVVLCSEHKTHRK